MREAGGSEQDRSPLVIEDIEDLEEEQNTVRVLVPTDDVPRRGRHLSILQALVSNL